MTQYVIIGDGISGSSAAETLREDPDSEITVITDEGATVQPDSHQRTRETPRSADLDSRGGTTSATSISRSTRT